MGERQAGTAGGGWQERYRDKVRSAQDAVRDLPNGSRVFVGTAAACPTSLLEALLEANRALRGVEVVHMLTLGPAPHVDPAVAGRFHHTSIFNGPNVRGAVQEGRADFVPVFLSEVPALLRGMRPDVALVQVSPPDAHGWASLGVSVDCTLAGLQAADLVIAEVNPRMPCTHGAAAVHVSDLDRLVPVDRPLPQRPPEAPDAVSAEIGRHVAALVPDGATLQVGIGRIPDAALALLHGRRELGVHTELLTDALMDLVEAGAVTGRCKADLPGKMVASFVMGTQRLYDWVHEHAGLEMRPCDYTNDVAVIGRQSKMVAINAALAVDLTGQVASDTLAGSVYSGIGGQVDFIRGASRSAGGVPILALPSTAKGGTVSRIQAVLEPGTAVTTSRGDVRWVVTEYGAVNLWGKSLRERAEALVGIAHPDHRAELRAAARGRRLFAVAG